jgi:hypothetical protein
MAAIPTVMPLCSATSRRATYRLPRDTDDQTLCAFYVRQSTGFDAKF